MARRTPLAFLALAVVLATPATPVQAEPRPSITQVQKRLDALNLKISMIEEEYAGTRMELARARRDAATAEGRVRRARMELDGLRAEMDSLAAALYRSGGTSQMVQLISTGDPQTFLDRASSLDRIAQGHSAQLARAATARLHLQAQRQGADARRDAAASINSVMSAQRRTIESAIAEQTRLLSSLRGDERQRLVQARETAARQDSRAARGRSVSVTYNGPASGRAAIAVKEAYRQLGKPYQWGAAGPDRFDCSGLTMWVWGKAGVSLPHQSRAQYAGGRKVAKSDLQPGDLTFYGNPIHHVGIYVGNGQMISSPQTGDVVKVRNAMRDDYVGAVRP